MASRFSDRFDFENCEDEPIRTPGGIQSFGALRLLDADSFCLLLESDNAGQLFQQAFAGLECDPSSGLPESFHRHLKHQSDSGKSVWPQRHFSPATEGGWHLTVHREGSHLLVELEPSDQIRPTAVTDLAALIQQVKSARTVEELMTTAADAVRGITGFDRTLVYRFAEDWHGEVVAESRDPTMTSFLGLHFPASDIPAQARQLYVENEIRLIADVEGDVVPLRAHDRRGPANPDLSVCSLRAVSPIHLQYLRNMGVRASMSISVIRDGRLWGLIACHHRSPRHVSVDARLAAKLVGDVLSLCLRLVEDSDAMRARLRHSLYQREILEAFLQSDELTSSLMAKANPLRRLFNASGFAVVERERVMGDGHLPGNADVLKLASWVRKQMGAHNLGLYHCNGWPEPVFPNQAETAAGVLALSPTSDHSVVVLWLRMEEPREIVWAGQHELVSGDPLNPRHSFEQWSQQRRGVARPWADWELDAAEEMLVALQKLCLRQLERLQRIAVNLERSNRDLEDFAFIASHDLQEPLRKIEALSSLILEELEQPDFDRVEVQGYVGRVSGAAARLRALVGDLLTYSRVGRLDYQVAECDWRDIIGRTIELLDTEIASAGAEVRLSGDFPVSRASPVLLRMVFQNLISNAVKYRNPDGPRPLVDVVSNQVEGVWRVDVIDNGIGFDPEKSEAIFKPFHRLHSKSRYPGSGIGLAIVRKAAERIGARVTASSSPGTGSCFSVIFPA
ncbi:MAG: ATP-binding protein [Marinobacter sp.]|uniref:ATP-binding protein n=1 Tax=Marinobacter sp. TaxID=50741 RepID=UPI00299ECA7F|nr:ATP-binding protein [Marinobacter sp.]MDX1635161.1 ATP-binding protein [Marinobacter sp.]